MIPLIHMTKKKIRKSLKKRSRHSHKETNDRSILKTLIHIGFIGFFIVTGIVLLWASTLKIPDLQSFGQRKIPQSTKIYDRTGEILLFDVHENVQRTIIPLNGISRNIKNAAVAIEDAEFYEHFGVKPMAFLRAVLVNVQSRRFSQGGSTITQQVIKNSVLTSEKKISRKIKEWVLAIKLEKVFTKDQILELYLNESPYGGNIYGIEEASKTYFDKTAVDLTLAEAAYMAALPQAPTFFSPYGNNKDRLDLRKDLVLTKMLENGFITQEEFDTAKNEEVVFRAQENTGIQAPHFVMFIREYLANKYGERALEERGFKVTTTLDFEMQQTGEEIVAKYAEINSEQYNAENAALIAIDPKTGQILTMVGSRNYFDEEIDGNFNVTLAHRQPGSSFKPFVYATALNKGYTPETVVFDLRTQFSTTCDVDELVTNDEGCYSPNNYNNKFRGPITMREALAQSLNIPAVKFLYLAGLRDSLQTAKNMGIRSLTDIGRYGLTLVLGGGEVSLIDMTSAYGVFANEGIRNPYTGILKIEDNEGNIIEEFKTRPLRVLPDQTALKISSILSDNKARSPVFGSRSSLHFSGKDVAVKTGTTNDYRDAWILGYTPTLAVGAWGGNNDNSPMDNKISGFIIAPLWNEFMWKTFETVPEEKFRSPYYEDISTQKPILRGIWDGGISYTVDKLSGNLATEFTPEELLEERVIKDPHTILYWVDKNNPRGPIPTNPDKDSQFEAWEYSVTKWKEENNIISETATSTPDSNDQLHTADSKPKISLLNINNVDIYNKSTPISVDIVINESKFPITRADYFINNNLISSQKTQPFKFTFIPQNISNLKENNTLTVVVYDAVFNKTESTVIFKTN